MRAFGAPLFLFLTALCLWPSAGRAAAPEAAANTSAGAAARVSIAADWLSYAEETGRMEGRGAVRIWYSNLTLTADAAEADLNTRWIKARGNVTLTETDRTIHCAELDYDLKDQSAAARGIRFATRPWFYQGEAVDKRGEKDVRITRARFTTCDARHPHYHLTASQIDVVLGESLTAHHAVLYMGTTPVFYLPWLQRSLRDSRPPFSIRVGYSDFEGFYARLRLNYYLAQDNYGGLMLDVMEKKGLGVGLEHHLTYQALGRGEGDLSVYYVRDQEAEAERWTAHLDNRHEFGERDQLQINLDYLTDHTFNREFSASLVDSYQQKSYLAYAHRGDVFYWSLSASDVESWDPARDAYLTQSRELPSAILSMSPQKLFHLGQPLYFNFSSNLSRSYRRVDVDPDGDLFAQDLRYRYEDTFRLTPGLTETYNFPLRVPTQPSLSGSLYLPLTGSYRETVFDDHAGDQVTPQTQLDAGYSTNLTLTNKWVNYRYTKPTHLVESRLSHDFSRQFSLAGDRVLQNAGVTSNRLGAGVDYLMGNFFVLRGSTGYNFHLAVPSPDWRDHMDPLSFSGNATLGSGVTLNWQGTHDWLKQRVTSGYVSASLTERDWNLSWNNSYSYLGTASGQEHSWFAMLSAGVRPGLGLSLQSGLQFEMLQKKFTNYSLTLSRDLHCWEMQTGLKVYADGRYEVGFGLNLKAFPEFHVGSGL